MQKVVCQTEGKREAHMRKGRRVSQVHVQDELSLALALKMTRHELTEQPSDQSTPNESTHSISPEQTEKSRSDETETDREGKVVFVLESDD